MHPHDSPAPPLPAFSARLGLLPLIAVAAMLAVLAACSPAPQESSGASSSETSVSAEAPAPEGEVLLEARCSSCHSADKARQEHKSRDGWQATVTRMVGKGAELSDAEQATLVDYLAATYGP